MSSLSQKDKNTLIIAGIALLIVGIIILGIKPAFTSIQETKAINDQLKATKTEMQNEINSLPTYEAGLEAAKGDYAKTTARIFEAYDADMIHDEVVALVESAALDIQGLTIGDITAQSIGYYTISEDGSFMAVGEGDIKMAYINVTVNGTTAQIEDFVNTLNLDEGVFIDQVSFADTDDIVTIPVTFYMVLAETF